MKWKKEEINEIITKILKSDYVTITEHQELGINKEFNVIFNSNGGAQNPDLILEVGDKCVGWSDDKSLVNDFKEVYELINTGKKAPKEPRNYSQQALNRLRIIDLNP